MDEGCVRMSREHTVFRVRVQTLVLQGLQMPLPIAIEPEAVATDSKDMLVFIVGSPTCTTVNLLRISDRTLPYVWHVRILPNDETQGVPPITNWTE